MVTLSEKKGRQFPRPARPGLLGVIDQNLKIGLKNRRQLMQMLEQQVKDYETEDLAARGHLLADQRQSPDRLQSMHRFSGAPCCGSSVWTEQVWFAHGAENRVAWHWWPGDLVGHADWIHSVREASISLLHLLGVAPNQAVASLPCPDLLPVLLLLSLLPPLSPSAHRRCS